MMQLSEELTSTENKVSFSRQAFNDQVMVYNTYKQSFPPVFFAPTFGMRRMRPCWSLKTAKPSKPRQKYRFNCCL